MIDITRPVVFGSFAVAFFVALAATPLAIWLAPRIGAIDIPKDSRRMHKKAMPRFGGMAVYLGVIVSMFVFLRESEKMNVVMIGGTLIYIVGAIDDVIDLPAKVKFCAQVFVAMLMYSLGLKIEFINNYLGAGNLHFGTVICFVVTIVWIVGITNTVNLIDGLDGLAAGVAAIAALSVAYVAYIHGDRFGFLAVCGAMMALAGGALGFLPYNFYPAKIFMGDSGSLFLGFMIAALSVVGPLKRSTIIAVIVPVVVLGIPIFDTLFAILRRTLNRKPIMGADKGHLHHHLMTSGYGQRRAVLMLYGISGIMGMAAVLISRELYKDAAVLVLISWIYLYVFLTDTDSVLPKIREREQKPDEDEGK